MRAAQAIDEVTKCVNIHFDDDVAKAIMDDAEVFEAAARHLGRAAESPQHIADVVARIAEATDDGLSDWLVSTAHSPAS